jgi:hypothetical protein
MSTENELNKTLSEIYTDLESLQSAREQIEIVTKSSANLTNSTSMLLQELREFSNLFGKENTSNISQLTQSLESFENKINSIHTKGNESISGYIETFKNKIDTVITQFEKKNKSGLSQLNQSLEGFENKINTISEKGNESISEYIKSFKKEIIVVIDQFSKQISENEKNLTAINSLNNEKIGEKIKQFEKTTKDLKVNAEQGIENIKSIAIAKIEKQEKEISKTILHIAETNLKTESLIKIIKNYDIPNSLENLDNKIESIVTENKSLKTMLFVIIGLLGLSIIGLLVKFL